MKNFRELGLSSQLVDTFEKLGFEEPTEIQEKSIPFIMEGRDIVGESATGSGKTLAFACGIIETVVPKKGLQALILTPTRELAEQIKNEVIKLSRGSKRIEILAVYGGTAMRPQISALRFAEVVIATPGRLLDHIQRGTIDISKINLLVLDEADRMLDMGFIHDIKRIIRSCPTERQTLLFSATISYEIQDLAQEFIEDAEVVSVDNQVDSSKLEQVLYDIPKNRKLSLLAHLLQEENSKLALVFCNTRRNTDFVCNQLRANGIDATAIHGGLTQNKRARTLKQFSGQGVEVLVCTDVAARGLHIENVSHVYNYDIPRNPVDYVHRIGRTARAGEEGKVINLLCDVDYANFRAICRKYDDFNIEDMPMPKITQQMRVVMPNRNSGGQRNFSGRSRFSGRGQGSDNREKRDYSRNRQGPRSYGRGPNKNRSNQYGPKKRYGAKPKRSGGRPRQRY